MNEVFYSNEKHKTIRLVPIESTDQSLTSQASGPEFILSPDLALFSSLWTIIITIPVVTLVSLSKTLHYNCFSPPVRAELVLVIDKLGLRYIFGGTGCILPRELRWFKE